MQTSALGRRSYRPGNVVNATGQDAVIARGIRLEGTAMVDMTQGMVICTTKRQVATIDQHLTWSEYNQEPTHLITLEPASTVKVLSKER